MKDIKWPAVVVVLGLLATLGALAAKDKDGTVVLAGVIAVLGALGFAHVSNKQTEIQEKQTELAGAAETIKEQTNGRIGQLTEMIQKHQTDMTRINEDHNRAMANLADQHRRDMKEMAEVLARMMPPPEQPPISISGGGAGATWREPGHSPDL